VAWLLEYFCSLYVLARKDGIAGVGGSQGKRAGKRITKAGKPLSATQKLLVPRF
jgi:hypothetical protein